MRAEQSTVDVIHDTRSAQALAHPLRLRILENLRKPDSASGLARKLQIPRQKINYHLRELERKGLVEQIEERRKGNCVERIVRATAKSYIINPETLGGLASDPDKIKDKFSSSYLVAVASRAIRDVALLRHRAEKAKKKLPTFTLQAEVRFATAADLNRFAEELAGTVARLVTKYHDDEAETGRLFKFILGSYPAITKTEGFEREQEDSGTKPE